MDKLDLNKLHAKDGVLTIVTRADKPAIVHYDKAIAIVGTIAAPGNYYEGRKDELASVIKKSHVVYDYSQLFIKLIAVENNEINTTVVGKLILNPDINIFKINTPQKFAIKDLYNLLRLNKFFFADRGQCQTIVEKLQNTKTTVEKNIETALNKGTGNEKNAYDIAVKGIEPMSIDLKMPIYVGMEASPIRVDINIDARSGDVLFWLESMELEEAKKDSAKAIMDIEISRFRGSGLVLIEQSGQSEDEN